MKRLIVILFISWSTPLIAQDTLVSRALEVLSIHLNDVCPSLTDKFFTPMNYPPNPMEIPKGIMGNDDAILLDRFYDTRLFPIRVTPEDAPYWVWVSKKLSRLIRYAPTFNALSAIEESRGIVFPKRGLIKTINYTSGFWRQFFRRVPFHPYYYIKFAPTVSIGEKQYVLIELGRFRRPWIYSRRLHIGKALLNNYWSIAIEFERGEEKRIIYTYSKERNLSSKTKREGYNLFELGQDNTSSINESVFLCPFKLDSLRTVISIR